MATAINTIRTKINNLTYEIRTYDGNQSCYCSGCQRTKKDKKVIYYHDHGLERKLCWKCYENIYNNAVGYRNVNKTQKPKAKKKQAGSTIKVDNPMKKLQLTTDINMSIFEIYVNDRNLYQMLAGERNEFKVKISPPIKKFLKINNKKVKSLAPDIAVSFLADEWMMNSKSAMLAREKVELQQIEQLLTETEQKKVVWIEEYSSSTSRNLNQRYVLYTKDSIYKFNVIGYKNADEVMKLSFELQEERERKVHTCISQYNNVLYKTIRQFAVRKENKEINPHVKKRDISEKKKIVEIKSNDFVVRTNLFRCYYKEHLVEEIIGVIQIVNRLGGQEEKKIPCAYCPECNCFYMLLSQYKELSSMGVLLCHLIDKDEYYSSGILSNFNAASESLLMRNGYNVKANNGLTDIQRQAILQNIMDNKILTPHRIVSYIDMFISQKQNMPQYNEAIEKWKKDRAFVLSYKKESKRVVKIDSIEQ